MQDKKNKKAKTIVCDIDGVLFRHYCDGLSGQIINKPEILKGVRDNFQHWDSKGYNIILLTGRKESLRSLTTNLLHSFGLYFDELVMGVGGGDRILINDRKPNGSTTAWAFNRDRNQGLKDITYDNLSSICEEYFELWSSKNLDALSNMFSDNIHLKDWNTENFGKDSVLKANEEIFSAVEKLSVDIRSLSHVDNKVIAEITVVADSETIPVVDIIKFNKESKIESIVAYRGI